MGVTAVAGETADAELSALEVAGGDTDDTGERDDEGFALDGDALVRSCVTTPLSDDEHPATSTAVSATAAQKRPAVPGRESLWLLWVTGGGEAASTDDHSPSATIRDDAIAMGDRLVPSDLPRQSAI